ncbi:MAG: HAD family hydrolase [Planctomycetota bacterium]|nr:MAG: HAD family hydrolase [Planctomycetota bacterium]
MFEAVLFDIGNTLVYFRSTRIRELLDAAARPAYERLAERGFRLPPYPRYAARIRRAFILNYIWSRLRGRETKLIRTLERVHAAMRIDLGETGVEELARLCTEGLRPFMHSDPQAVPVLEELRRAGLKLGIVSNTHFPGFAIDGFLAEEGLLDFFPVRVYSSDVRFMKPNPRIFQLALERMAVAPGRALFVGDRPDKDVSGAARVGMRTVLLVGGAEVPNRHGADHVIRSLAELCPLLGCSSPAHASGS